MRRTFVVALALVLFAAWPARAQQQPMLTGLEKTLVGGDEIEITDTTGTVIRGRYQGVTAAVLRLRVDGSVREIQEPQIYQVRKRRHEGDGILLGLGIGALAGLAYVQIHCRGAGEHGDCVRAGSVIVGAPAAAAGALIDLGLKRFDTVFVRTTSLARGWRVAPLLGGRTGVAFTIAF